MVGPILAVGGVALFQYSLFEYGWTHVFIWIVLVSLFFSLLQLLLCYKMTFGLPLVLFSTSNMSLQTAVQ